MATLLPAQEVSSVAPAASGPPPAVASPAPVPASGLVRQGLSEKDLDTVSVIASNSAGMDGTEFYRTRLASLSGNQARFAALSRADGSGELAARALIGSLGSLVPKDSDWLIVQSTAAEPDGAYQFRRLVQVSADAVAGSAFWAQVKTSESLSQDEYRGGNLVQSTRYGNDGLLISDWRYGPANDGTIVLKEKRDYHYLGTRLVSVASLSSDSGFVSTTRLSYTLDGRIRQTEKTTSDGSLERFVYRYGDNGVAEAWSDSPDSGTRWIYDDKGRLATSEVWQDSKVRTRTSNTYQGPESRVLASRETLDIASGNRTLDVFDSDGRLVQSDVSTEGKLVSRQSQVWDENGLIQSKISWTPTHSETWLYEYTDKTLAVERYSRDDVPVKVSRYKDQDRIDELYFQGRAVVRVYYHGAQVYREEELHDGQVIRTRDYD